MNDDDAPRLVDVRLDRGDVDSDVTRRHTGRVGRHVRVLYGKGNHGNVDAVASGDGQLTAGGRDAAGTTD